MSVSSPDSQSFPVDSLREIVVKEVERQPIFMRAPTGTGKSSRVPLWLKGQVVMVQPRRVAARNVAARLAETLGCQLGQEVGYQVRDEKRCSESTRILVVTPGIALKMHEFFDSDKTLILDELHERRWDVDLLFALALKKKTKLIALSATMNEQKVAAHMKGLPLAVDARNFPVSVTYASKEPRPPHDRHLSRRIAQAVKDLLPLKGHVLIFVPGKREITETEAALAAFKLPLFTLHGGLSLKEQARVIQGDASQSPRIIIATNVAETSLTIAGVDAVIDSGLVRRTRYHEGRAYLCLTPIALDSAEQRSGRAGRTRPGRAVRLWHPSARLESSTQPEVYRESLVPRVLACAHFQEKIEELPFYDPPKEYALLDAQERLHELGALTPSGGLSNIGKELARAPIDPELARFLLQAQKDDTLPAALDLAAALCTPGFSRQCAELYRRFLDEPCLELAQLHCDLTRFIHLTRLTRRLSSGGAIELDIDAELLKVLQGPLFKELEKARQRLQSLFKSTEQQREHSKIGSLNKRVPAQFSPAERTAILTSWLRADPKSAHIKRERKRRIAYNQGGTDLTLSKHSSVAQTPSAQGAINEPPPALIALSLFARENDQGNRELLISEAAPVPLSLLNELKFGEVSNGEITFKKGQLRVQAERHYCGQLLSRKDIEPKGRLARQALVELYLRGSLKRNCRDQATARLARRALAHRLGKKYTDSFFNSVKEPPQLKDWFTEHLLSLGVESADDLQLLSDTDYLPEDLDSALRDLLSERYPTKVDLGDACYRVDYDLTKNQALLIMTKGSRKLPPSAQYLPKIEGFKLFVEAGGVLHAVKR